MTAGLGLGTRTKPLVEDWNKWLPGQDSNLQPRG